MTLAADYRAPFILDPQEDFYTWLQDTYLCQWLYGRPPHHVLIVGGPEYVPFRFQSLLGSAASVGRIHFETIAELQAYITKIVNLERAATGVVNREAVFFAPVEGPHDPTWLSREYLARPPSEFARTEAAVSVQEHFDAAATKQRLLEIGRTRPALVFTASHGMGAPNGTVEEQARVTGAICCQSAPGQMEEDWLFTADDIPTTEPFLEGSVLFQFACFGFGTRSVRAALHGRRSRSDARSGAGLTVSRGAPGGSARDRALTDRHAPARPRERPRRRARREVEQGDSEAARPHGVRAETRPERSPVLKTGPQTPLPVWWL